jgi:hypothetical protein
MSAHATTARCQYTNKRGQRCRMLRSPSHPALCAHHAGQKLKLVKREKPPEKFGAELLGPLGYLDTSSAVNYALSKLLLLAADRRIPPREAASLGYLCQLLLQSIHGVAKEQGIALDFSVRQERLGKIYESIPALQDVEEDEEEEEDEEGDEESAEGDEESAEPNSEKPSASAAQWVAQPASGQDAAPARPGQS